MLTLHYAVILESKETVIVYYKDAVLSYECLIVVRNTFQVPFILLQKSSKLNEKNVQEKSDFLKMNLLIFAIVSCSLVRVR